MTKRILMIMVVGMLSACVSGTKPHDTYTAKDGTTTIIESDREMCQRLCNESQSRCMESSPASDKSAVNGPSGLFGASGDCRNALQSCLRDCKTR